MVEKNRSRHDPGWGAPILKGGICTPRGAHSSGDKRNYSPRPRHIVPLKPPPHVNTACQRHFPGPLVCLGRRREVVNPGAVHEATFGACFFSFSARNGLTVAHSRSFAAHLPPICCSQRRLRHRPPQSASCCSACRVPLACRR